MRVFEIPARIVLGVYLVWDNILPLIITAGQGGGGVAHGAHIGGFVAGLAGAWVIDRATTTARPPEYASAPGTAPAPSAIEAAIERGDMEAAARVTEAEEAYAAERCHAPTRTGGRCKNRAVAGQSTCRIHSGEVL